MPSVPPVGTRRTAIVVLGVGRSGTSALTRAISLLGAALPADVLGAGPGNERGHWEPARLLDLHDEILRLHNRSWWSLVPVAPAWYATAQAEAFVRRAMGIVVAEYGAAPLIVIKDPRLCLVGPVLFAALDRLGIEVRVVLPLRHPGEVARSIDARDSRGAWRGELQWLSHMIAAEALSRGFPRVWVTFDAVLADWRAAVCRISDALRLEWRVPIEGAGEAIEAFLSPRLRHFDVERQDLRLFAAGLSRAIWRAALAGVDGDETGLRAAFAAAPPLLAWEITRFAEAARRPRSASANARKPPEIAPVVAAGAAN